MGDVIIALAVKVSIGGVIVNGGFVGTISVTGVLVFVALAVMIVVLEFVWIRGSTMFIDRGLSIAASGELLTRAEVGTLV